MTNDKLEKELDKPAINTMVIVVSYLVFGTYGMLLLFLFFIVGYIYQYYKNRNKLYREKLFRFALYTLPIYTLYPILWVAQ
jgi:type II secretory pathway component PulF